jgi:hypothetical protein
MLRFIAEVPLRSLIRISYEISSHVTCRLSLSQDRPFAAKDRLAVKDRRYPGSPCGMSRVKRS